MALTVSQIFLIFDDLDKFTRVFWGRGVYRIHLLEYVLGIRFEVVDIDSLEA